MGQDNEISSRIYLCFYKAWKTIMSLGKLTFQSLKCISEFRLGKLQAKSTVATKAFTNSIFNWSFTHHTQKTKKGKLLSCERWERFSRNRRRLV